MIHSHLINKSVAQEVREPKPADRNLLKALSSWCAVAAISAVVVLPIMQPAEAQNADPEYVDTCLNEATKDRPDMKSVEDECRLAGKYLKRNNHIGNASWVYLLSNQWDAAMRLSNDAEGLEGNSVLYMNQGHVAAMRGDYEQAEALYRRHIEANTRPVGEGFDDDLNNILPKIFPEYDDELAKAKTIWAEQYEALEAIDKKHLDMEAMMEMGDLRSAQTLMEEAQSIKREADLQQTRGYLAGQIYLADLSEVNSRFGRAIEINDDIIANAQRLEDSDDIKGWYLGRANSNLGRLALRARDYDTAAMRFEQSDALLSNSDLLTYEVERWNGRYSLAATLSAQGDYQAALDILQQSIASIKDDNRLKDDERMDVEVRFRRSEANLLARRGEYVEGISLLDALIDEQLNHNPEPTMALASSYVSLAKIYAKKGDQPAANRHFELAVEVASAATSSESLFTYQVVIKYIYFLKQIGDHDKVQQLMESYRVDPDLFSGMDLIL